MRRIGARQKRKRSIMDEHFSGLEDDLDAEVIDALDESISHKMEENDKQKTRSNIKHFVVLEARSRGTLALV